jgi:hypothetical protein
VKRIDLVGFVSLKVLIQFGETDGSNWTNSDGDPERWILCLLAEKKVRVIAT